MGKDRLDRLERLFRAAQMHAPEDRTAFLEAACADDPAMRRELHDLLQADGHELHRAGGFAVLNQNVSSQVDATLQKVRL